MEQQISEKTTATSVLPAFRPGDTVKVHYRIIEGGKVRIQPYEGIVIAQKGSGVSKTFTVRRIGADSVGVERIFPLFSPNIEKIEVLKAGKVRRSKLYYLRDRIGRAAMKIKEGTMYIPTTETDSPTPETAEVPEVTAEEVMEPKVEETVSDADQ